MLYMQCKLKYCGSNSLTQGTGEAVVRRVRGDAMQGGLPWWCNCAAPTCPDA